MGLDFHFHQSEFQYIYQMAKVEAKVSTNSLGKLPNLPEFKEYLYSDNLIIMKEIYLNISTCKLSDSNDLTKYTVRQI